MPLPMRPHPSTPTRLISVMARSDDLEGLADLVGEAHERVRPRSPERVVRPDLAALQPVEHLLEPHHDALVVEAVAARRGERRRPDDERRQERPRPEHAQRRYPGSERRAEADQTGRAPQPPGALAS